METISALVLCGGSGRRVGGADKALLEYRGQPLVQHVLASIRQQTSKVIISANRNLASYAELAPTITDAPNKSSGPLTGVLRGLQEIETAWMWVCPGDAPLLAPDLLRRLCVARTPTNRLVTPHDGHRNQWLHMLVHADLQDSLADYLACGGESVHGWIESIPEEQRVSADCSDIGESFLNINTLAQLES